MMLTCSQYSLADTHAARLQCILLCSYVSMHAVMQLYCHACCYAAMLPCTVCCFAAMLPCLLLCSNVAMHVVLQQCCHACCSAAMLPCMLFCSNVVMHAVMQLCCPATVLHCIHVFMQTAAMKLWRYTKQPSRHAALQSCRCIHDT